jgi:hypothetical protein
MVGTAWSGYRPAERPAPWIIRDFRPTAQGRFGPPGTAPPVGLRHERYVED